MTTPVERFLAKLTGVESAGNGWSACCPAHDDKRSSLSIGEGDDGRVLIHCHAGCETEAVCQALGLRVVDLMLTPGDHPKTRLPSREHGKMTTYDYCDEKGILLFQVVRFDPKDFRQRKPKPEGGWDWSVKGVRIVPYRLCELLASPSEPVVIAEGEKDCDNLARISVLATCNAGGAGKWTADHSDFLNGRRVIVLPDNDDAGRKHAAQVARSLQNIAESVRIVDLPYLPVKGDVSDWIAAGGTKSELLRLAETAELWTPNAPEPWPEIISFDMLELPAFPTQALPDVLRKWVESESHATQTPADLAAMLGLAVCSACIARRLVVEPRPGWHEPVNLFVAVLLEPGNRKSAVFSSALKPLREWEAELIEAARPVVARAQSERRLHEGRLRKLEKIAAEQQGDKAAEAREQAGNLAADLAAQAEPALPQLLVDDATAEKLEMMLDDQGGRIASMSPEGGVFDLMAGLYSKNNIPQFGVYLKGHSGDDLNTDRVSRKSIRVVRPALTCAYAMQPAVIEGLAGNEAFRGRGLLARFLYSAPQSWIGRRAIAPTPVTDSVRQAYRLAVRTLIDNCGNIGNHSEPFVLRLSHEAARLLCEWETEIEAMLGDGGKLELMRDWGAKLAGATLRLAAVLHCMEHGPKEHIEVRSIAAAVEIASYLIPHAEAVFNKMLANEETADDDARYILRWIERQGRKEFTKSEAQHHGKRRFSRADDIDPGLAELIRRGFIRCKSSEVTGRGRPPSPSFEVNPKAFSFREKPEKRSYNSRNSSGETDCNNSGNIGSAFETSNLKKRTQVSV